MEQYKIHGKLKDVFGLSTKCITVLKANVTTLFNNTSSKNLVTPTQLHQIVLNLFIKEYYPIVSRNIRMDNNNSAIIMGGMGFNMNIPPKMDNFLNTETEDIDLKIYTTDIDYMNKKPQKLNRVLSIFKFIIIILCFYLKQIAVELVNISKEIYPPSDYIPNKHIINSNPGKKHTKKSQTTKQTKTSPPTQKGGFPNIKYLKRDFGFIKSIRVDAQFKIDDDKIDEINLLELDYPDLQVLLMEKINNPDLLITNKIKYDIQYKKPLFLPFNKNRITFSDSKIIYPNAHYPAFYSYYFMNNKRIGNINIEKLIKQNIPVSSIIDTKPCKNNCRYISIKSLLIDTILMLSYAELLELEDEEHTNVILVPVRCLYKYYKYIIKYIRLHIIKKFYNSTLTKNFVETAKKLIRYIYANIKKDTVQLETDPINIQYKKLLNKFHQSFFIKKTMFPEYEVLREIVTDYETTVIYLNKSRALFKQADDKKGSIGESIESITIQYADKIIVQNSINEAKLSENVKTDAKIDAKTDAKPNKKIQKGGKQKKHVILHEGYNFDDIDLDNNKNMGTKHITKKSSILERSIILTKIDKVMKNEIHFLNQLLSICK
jgi:hypothetical protein